jgi:hypothetical protein
MVKSKHFGPLAAAAGALVAVALLMLMLVVVNPQPSLPTGAGSFSIATAMPLLIILTTTTSLPSTAPSRGQLSPRSRTIRQPTMLPTGSRCKEGAEKGPPLSKSKTKEERGGQPFVPAPLFVMDGAFLVGRWGCSSVASRPLEASSAYSPECVEGKFCELHLTRFLRREEGRLGITPRPPPYG